jgi:hypothetical protein
MKFLGAYQKSTNKYCHILQNKKKNWTGHICCFGRFLKGNSSNQRVLQRCDIKTLLRPNITRFCGWKLEYINACLIYEKYYFIFFYYGHITWHCQFTLMLCLFEKRLAMRFRWWCPKFVNGLPNFSNAMWILALAGWILAKLVEIWQHQPVAGIYRR